MTLAAMAIGVAQVPRAAEWDLGAGVTTSALYTDNFCLIQGGDAEEVVGTVTPRINLSGTGARASVAVRGGVEFNTLDQIDTECPRIGVGGGGQLANRESVIPNIGVAGDLEIIRNTLTLTVDAEARQNPIDPFRAGANQGVNGRDNTNISERYGAGAIFQRRLGSVAAVSAQYEYSEQYNAVNLLGDNTQHSASMLLGTQPDTGRISLAVSGIYQRIEVDDSALGPAFENELSRAELRSGFLVSESFELSALGGEEWNEFLTTGTDEIDGTYWDVGFIWRPNSRTEVSAGTGERFFGDTPRAEVSWRHKRSALRFSYARTVQFPRNLRTPGRVPTRDPVIDDIFDDEFGALPGSPQEVGTTPTFIGNSPILSERLQFSYAFSGRRTRVALNAAESLQTRALDGGQGEFRNASITLGRTLSSVLSFDLGVNWLETEGRGGNVGLFGQNAQTWRGTLALTRRIARNTDVSLSYQYVDRQSDFALNAFEENRVILSLSHQFR